LLPEAVLFPPVNTVSQPVNTSAVVIRSAEGAGVVLLTNRVETPGRQGGAKLVFHRYGASQFLAEIWDADRGVGSRIPTTKQERKLARNPRETLATILIAAHVAAH
jgi:hypothetical protein